MHDFANWLYYSSVSETIQNVSWIIPATQTVHILSIAIFFTSILMIVLRAMGLAAREQSLQQVADRFMPWAWGAALLLLLSGLVLILGEPTRELLNPAFWAKMALVLMVVIAFWQLQVRLPAFDKPAGVTAVTAPQVLVSVAIMAALCVVIFLGRWIAYTQPF